MTWPIQFLLHFSARKNITMKIKKSDLEEQQPDNNNQHHLEILKAVAQAWHSHSGSARSANEFDAHRRNFKGNPSRFKLEAINRRTTSSAADRSFLKWDFRQSLWDSYEIVAVSRRLETGLVLDGDSFGESDGGRRVNRKQRESNKSLRNLFNRTSSRRFNE